MRVNESSPPNIGLLTRSKPAAAAGAAEEATQNGGGHKAGHKLNISGPTNFAHNVHVVFDPSKGEFRVRVVNCTPPS